MPVRGAEAPSVDNLVGLYMAGNWDELAKELSANAAQLKHLTGQQQIDAAYLKQALIDGRPQWWNACKAEKQTPIRASIFGQMVSASFVLNQKVNLNMKFSGVREMTVSWPSAEMDSAANAEHGFTKGELNGMVVWGTLSNAAVYSKMPMTALANLSENDKARLIETLDFRSMLAGVYYGNPRTRQWGLFLALHTWLPKYAKMQTVMSRKALGAMLVAELVENSEKYDSIKIPKIDNEENAEERLALGLQGAVEKHGFTFAEDKLVRAAIKNFATANEDPIRTAGAIKLPNGLVLALDPTKDESLRAKRDAWLFAHLPKAR